MERDRVLPSSSRVHWNFPRGEVVFEGKKSCDDDRQQQHLPVGDFLLYSEGVRRNHDAAPYDLLSSADVAALVDDEPLSGHYFDLQWLCWCPQQQQQQQQQRYYCRHSYHSL